MLSIKQTSRIKEDIRMLFKFAETSKYPSYRITVEFLKIQEKYPKSITNYERFYFKGIYETYLRFFEDKNIIFCHVLKSGEILEAKTHDRYDEIVSDGLYYRDFTDYFSSSKGEK